MELIFLDLVGREHKFSCVKGVFHGYLKLSYSKIHWNYSFTSLLIFIYIYIYILGVSPAESYIKNYFI